MLNSFCHFSDEDWGDDDEWEWESEEEEEELQVATEPEKTDSKMISDDMFHEMKAAASQYKNNTANGIANGTSAKTPSVTNGTTHHQNGTTLKHMENGSGGHGKVVCNGDLAHTNGHHVNGINVEDKIVEEATGTADIQIQGNLLKIARTGPVDWSDDEYEDDTAKKPPASIPAPPPPPPPAPAPPPPPPPKPPGKTITVKT